MKYLTPPLWTIRAHRRTLMAMPSEAVARQARVTRGFLRLGMDEPYWPWAINLGMLVIGDHHWGVLGQVYAHRAGLDRNPHFLGLDCLGIPLDEAAAYGFEPLDDEDRDALGLIWGGHVERACLEAVRPAATSDSPPPVPLPERIPLP